MRSQNSSTETAFSAFITAGVTILGSLFLFPVDPETSFLLRSMPDAEDVSEEEDESL
jgi:hypothetical protein